MAGLTVIYVDTLFLLNAIVDYLLLLCSARLAGERLSRLRFALGALLGGLYAVALFLPGFGFLGRPLCRLSAAVLMVLSFVQGTNTVYTRLLLAALAAGDLAGVARRMYNVFEDVLPERRGAEGQRIKNALVQQGALGASMSGTGSTVFGLFDREEAARRAYELLQESYRDTFLARSLEKMV